MALGNHSHAPAIAHKHPGARLIGVAWCSTYRPSDDARQDERLREGLADIASLSSLLVRLLLRSMNQAIVVLGVLQVAFRCD